MESTSFRNLNCFEPQDQNMEIFSNLSPTTVVKTLESSSKFGKNMNRIIIISRRSKKKFLI